jgi:hypothetical protein
MTNYVTVWGIQGRLFVKSMLEDLDMRFIASAVLVIFSFLSLSAQNPSANDTLTDAVTRMARIGRCGSPSFSPDGNTLAVVCDMTGTPQVWTVSSKGAGRTW